MTKKQTNDTNPIEFSFDSLDAAHDDVLAASPEADQHTIDAHAEDELAVLRDQADNVDKDGTIFDADIHAVNKDGEPSITPTGKFRKRRGSVVATQSTAAKTVQDEASARATGQLAADLLIGSAVTLLGDEWIPIGEEGKQEPMKFDEHSNMRRAFGDYFVAKNITDFPPGVMLSLAISSYAGARIISGEETKSRLSRAWVWTKDTASRFFGKRKKDAAHDNSRDNGVRKDDSGKVSVQSSEEAKQRHPST